MNPCIIIYNKVHERYEAFDEDARFVTFSRFGYRMCVGYVEMHGFQNVPLNSRLGRTIFDKLPLTVQMRGHSQ